MGEKKSFAFQVFNVCDVSDHDGRDELCDSPQCVLEDPQHSHNDRHSSKGETADQPNTSLNVMSSDQEVSMELFSTG